ncbi:MAG: hypothetical protein WC356_03440 [Candidatus Micrarchaeia archaeon]
MCIMRVSKQGGKEMSNVYNKYEDFYNAMINAGLTQAEASAAVNAKMNEDAMAERFPDND